MTNLPKIVRERMRTAVTGDHPDPDLLTAFAEQALPERERMPLLEHLARCADCRDVLALAAAPAGSAATHSNDTGAARKAPWFSFPVLRWGALAACLVVVGAAVLMHREEKVAYTRKDMPQAAFSAYAPAESVRPDSAPANPSETKTKALATAETPSAFAPSVSAPSKVSREKTLTLSIPAPAQTVGGGAIRQPAAPASGASPALAKDLRDDRQMKAAHGALAFDVGTGNGIAPSPAPPPTASVVPAVPAPTNKNVPAPHLTSNAQNFTAPAEPLAQMNAVIADSDKSEKKVEIPGRAKTAAAPASAALAVAPNDDFEMQKSNAPAALEASRARKELARSVRPETLRWNISSDGQLQRSADSGKSWQPVIVAEGATFRALTFNGPDIWVGGAAGSLYHSSDAGAHWVQVKPVANNVPLSGDIAAIAFTDPQHGKITTTNGQTWSTNDGGQSWDQQQ